MELEFVEIRDSEAAYEKIHKMLCEDVKNLDDIYKEKIVDILNHLISTAYDAGWSSGYFTGFDDYEEGRGYHPDGNYDDDSDWGL